MRLGNPNLAVDTKAENEGKWVECPVVWWFDPSLPMRVLIRGTANQDFQAAIRSKTKDMSSTDQFKNAFEISAELVADYLLIGWENVFAEDGSPVQYSKQVAREIAYNRDNRRFVDFIYSSASNLNTFNAEARKDAEKN